MYMISTLFVPAHLLYGIENFCIILTFRSLVQKGIGFVTAVILGIALVGGCGYKYLDPGCRRVLADRIIRDEQSVSNPKTITE